MRFLHGKKKVNRGGSITVTCSKPTRVLVMREREYKRYKQNMSFTYFGGKKDSTYEVVVPQTDVWHVIVEKGTYYNPEDITATFSAKAPEPAPKRVIAHTMAEADAQLDGDEVNEDNAEEESTEEEEDK